MIISTTTKKRIAIIAPRAISSAAGGAERFYEGLREAIDNTGSASAEIIEVVWKDRNFQEILGSYARCEKLDLAGYDAVISSKAPGYAIRHTNHICYLMHTVRSYYDMFEVRMPWLHPRLRREREMIFKLDRECLTRPRVKALLAIGEEVSIRLQKYIGLSPPVMYHGTTLRGLHAGPYLNFFMPGRLHRWKRTELVIRAMRLVRPQLKLLIAGEGDEEPKLRQLASSDPRIVFLGRIGELELAEQYSKALAVPFVPVREDFGLVSVEAFQSRKPIITTTDAGEPARIAGRSGGGIVCEPTPRSIAAAMNRLADNPKEAETMGIAGSRYAAGMSWTSVAARLLELASEAKFIEDVP